MADIQLVVFQLENQHYAVEIDYVNGINRVKDFQIYKMPNCPDFIEGIINLRGKVIPLYNLGKRFFNKNFINQYSEILIVFINGTMLGLIVDEVSDIIRLEDKDVEPADNLLMHLDNKFIDSVGKMDNNMIIILDVATILSQAEQQQIKHNI